MAKNKGGGGGGGKPSETGVQATISMTPEITNKDGKSIGEVASEAAVTGLVGVLAAIGMKVLSDRLTPLFGVKNAGEKMIPKSALDKQQAYIKQLKQELAEAKSGDDESDDD